MRRSFLTAAVLALAAVATAPARAQDAAWTPLFNGKDLTGWVVNDFTGKSKWEVVNGELVGSGTASMITTEKGGFKNFRFRAEIKINDKGNSGMYFRTTAKPGFTDGYECQINSTHVDPIKTGSIYTWVHVYEELVKPDTWFTQEVEVKDVDYRGKVVASITVKVNDKVIYQFLDHTRQFKEGHFAFQQHDPGSKVQIRKVEVMALPDDTKGK